MAWACVAALHTMMVVGAMVGRDGYLGVVAMDQLVPG
jgi:hypothetical protein